MSNAEKTAEARGADYRSPSVSSSEGKSEIRIEPIQSRRQHYPEIFGTGDGLLTPQISRLSHNSLSHKTISIGTTGSNDPGFEVDWKDENDPENPWNWPLPYTAMCIAFL